MTEITPEKAAEVQAQIERVRDAAAVLHGAANVLHLEHADAFPNLDVITVVDDLCAAGTDAIRLVVRLDRVWATHLRQVVAGKR